MTQGFDELKEITSAMNRSFKHGAASRQAEIDKIKSDNQLFESQIGQACVKWKEIAEKRQAEIDALQKRLAMYEREGYKLVPVEPTQKMIDDAVNDTPETPSQDYWHDSQPITDDQAIACYKSMIGAVE